MAPSSRRGRTNKSSASVRSSRKNGVSNSTISSCGDNNNNNNTIIEDIFMEYGKHITDVDEEDIVSDEEGDNDDDDEENDIKCCLHCRNESSEVQVRCDECTSYICQECHWCHEFQANHEIRVCDRCDAFYCRRCDEMDQCDDCAEVVCASCSTLLSCKFCGCGLCEECATACGRCGIVLCSRDSKFAVDCDTCRLSYCLVCLASGSKDPCVRCGHRPSKRMEQLVHLRLKSIYKAFKQNSSVNAISSNAKDQQIEELDVDHFADDPESLLQAAATAAKRHPSQKYMHDGYHGSLSSTPNMQHNNKRAIEDDVVDSTQERVTRYKEEKAKADAAAAALLAELDEEEEAETKKKSKKKKKKARQQAKKEDEVGTFTAEPAESDERDNYDYADDVSLSHKGIEDVKPAADSMIDADHEDETNSRVDVLEKEILDMVQSEDEEGLEKLLATMKGIPGRALLRKNIKKALKRFKLMNSPEEEDVEDVDSRSGLPEQEVSIDESKNMGEYSESIERAETPTLTNCDETNGLLSVVSITHNKPPGHNVTTASSTRLRSECIMQIEPTIVGWVIGKGGGRIRDLMDASGARVWIDQDNMGPNDPRTVYVSGSRKCVDIAIELIKELVTQAPYSPPISRQTTPVVASSSNLKSADKSAPTIPQNSDTIEKSGTSIRGKTLPVERLSSRTDVRTKQILTCEQRFVPLLIGRRGWTIKNIQDSTGAKVDIDQSVDPRKITISGFEDNVEQAVGMVRDVLSYPHAQLQSTVEENIVHDKTGYAVSQTTATQPPQPLEPKTTIDSPSPNAILSSPPLALNIRACPSSPPSSLIMTGDAKSTFSASSSLSSTPEPSMTSVKALPVLQSLPTGPRISTQNSHDIFSGCAKVDSHNPFANQQKPPPNPMTGQQIFLGSDALSPANASLFGGGISQAIPPLDTTRSQMGDPLQQMSPIVSERSTFNTHAASGVFPPIPTNPLPRAQGSFQQIDYTRAHSDPITNFGNSEARSASWGRQGDPMGVQHHTPPSDGFSLNAAFDFLEHSVHRYSTTSSTNALTGGVGGMSGYVGLQNTQNPPVVLPPCNVGAPGPPLTSVRDDAQIIDSLFGPSQGDTTINNGSSLLSGLQGLTIVASPTSNSNTGLWGPAETPTINDSLFPHDPPTGGLSLPHHLSRNSMRYPSSILAPDSKSQSRFAWGESGHD